MSNLPAILISDIEIRQDAEGRFCLNDLHKASGGAQKHRPKYWLALRQSQDLIDELAKGGIPPLANEPVKVIRGGNRPGIFVVKELVYSYAMWVSPKFHLHVIRTFDAIQTRPSQPEIKDPAMRLIVSMALEFDAVKQEQARLREAQQEQRELGRALIKRDRQRARSQAQLEQKFQAIETAIEYFTIIGWWSLTYQESLPTEVAAQYGRIAAKYCRKHGYEIGKTVDSRYGRVNTYPKEVLDELFLD